MIFSKTNHQQEEVAMKKAWTVVFALLFVFVFGQASADELGFDPQLLVGEYHGTFKVEEGGQTISGSVYVTIKSVEGDKVAWVLYFSASVSNASFNRDINGMGKLEGNTISSNRGGATVVLNVVDKDTIDGYARVRSATKFTVTRKK
ncbi:MAG: hypothetical protein Q7R91_02195 [bacterium]|nr:hypothetical protein [bacterium]